MNKIIFNDYIFQRLSDKAEWIERFMFGLWRDDYIWLNHLLSLSSILSNRKEAILSTIRDAEERFQEATNQLEQARERLNQAKIKAEEIRANGITQIERGKKELIQAANEDAKRLEESKNATLRFEEQRAIEKVRQQVSRLAMDRALETLKNRLNINSDLHERIIDNYIGLLKSMPIGNI